MKKEIAIQIITSCAKEYQNQLENRNLLFLFGTMQRIEYFEAAFLPQNFLHLTGVELKSDGGSSNFYDKCLKGKLSSSEFGFAKNGTTEMKLMILPKLMQIHKSAKMVGTYNNSKSFLVTDKLVGNVAACMGFIERDRFYIPNTSLKEDIRDITSKPQQRVLAIFRKDVSAVLYSSLTYIATGINLNDINLIPIAKGKLDLPHTPVAIQISEDHEQQHPSITGGSVPVIASTIEPDEQPSKEKVSISDRLDAARAKIANQQAIPVRGIIHKDSPEK